MKDSILLSLADRLKTEYNHIFVVEVTKWCGVYVSSTKTRHTDHFWGRLSFNISGENLHVSYPTIEEYDSTLYNLVKHGDDELYGCFQTDVICLHDHKFWEAIQRSINLWLNGPSEYQTRMLAEEFEHRGTKKWNIQ